MSPLELADEAARTRITTDTATTLFVEAEAGSGKTHSLVQRICRLVLYDGIELDRITAITFTGKAAAELRERVRVELADTTSRIGPEGARPDRRRRHRHPARVRGAHHRRASTRTGVPPRIEVVDAMGSQLCSTSLAPDADAPVQRRGITRSSSTRWPSLWLLGFRSIVPGTRRCPRPYWDRIDTDDDPQGIAPADIDRILGKPT